MRGFRHLGRKSSHRRSMLRTMTDQLVIHERIKTTVAKAKEVRKFADRMITQGKGGTLHNWNIATSWLQTTPAASKVFNILAPRFANRDGGYTRIIKCENRKGDHAEMAYIEFVDNNLIPLRSPKISNQSTTVGNSSSPSPSSFSPQQKSINDLD
eukprot:TRINITY_DN14927_c0_g1_i1.p1 TRINITY_DN14927_c0_g1~~TRINITY_DN14927_c0_g1_i1.p1  ORF type:complete len:155 (-),score=48.25 TRINITY_DN14927_c0_g1_i1:47-511(-)